LETFDEAEWTKVWKEEHPDIEIPAEVIDDKDEDLERD
jgi:hypothetical protein